MLIRISEPHPQKQLNLKYYANEISGCGYSAGLGSEMNLDT